MQKNWIKITNATYRILDSLLDSEPLKNKAKEKALEILESLVREKKSVEILDDIEILKSYLKLAKYQGLISDINFLILEKEYNQIKEQISVIKPVKKDVLLKTKEEKIIDVGRLEDKRGGGRQEKILEIIAKKDKTQVADIIRELPNVTKRTIRRDLDGLLKEGKVMRMGEFNQIFYQIS